MQNRGGEQPPPRPIIGRWMVLVPNPTLLGLSGARPESDDAIVNSIVGGIGGNFVIDTAVTEVI